MVRLSSLRVRVKRDQHNKQRQSHVCMVHISVVQYLPGKAAGIGSALLRKWSAMRALRPLIQMAKSCPLGVSIAIGPWRWTRLVNNGTSSSTNGKCGEMPTEMPARHHVLIWVASCYYK